MLGGIPDIVDPNAGAPTTGAVSLAGTLPAIESPASTEVRPRISTARLFPARAAARRQAYADLLLSTAGDVQRVGVALQRRAGRSWRTVRSYPSRSVEPGPSVRPLALGRLARGGTESW